MAHYSKKLSVIDYGAASERCRTLGMHFMYRTTETDYYFTEYAKGQFQRIRTYSPPISTQIMNETGEMRYNPAGIVPDHPDRLADLIASHRLVLSGTDNPAGEYADIVVLNIPNDNQADEFIRIMQKNRPLDSVVIKERTAFWHNVSGADILIHLDKSVKNEDGHDLGAFIEFEIKLPFRKTISDEKKNKVFDILQTAFSDITVDIHECNYRNMLRDTFGDYGSLVRTVPAEMLKEMKNLPEVRFNKDERIIADFDTGNKDGFFILSGAVDVRYSTGLHIRTIGKHDFFGEMAVDTGIRNADVTAADTVVAKRLPEDFLRKVSDDITIAKHFMHRLREDEIKKTLSRLGI